MITVGTFSTPEDAHLLRIRLGAGGVTAFLRNEYFVQMMWLYSNASGGVCVEVFENDAERANEILSEKLDDSEPLSCPFCESEDTRPDNTTRRLSFLSVLLFRVPLPVAKNRHECLDCNRTWNEWKRPPNPVGSGS